MSQIALKRTEPTADEKMLQDRLIQEFLDPKPGRVQPLFAIEKPGDRVHLFVVWDEWRYLPMRERSRLVLDAYEVAFGEEKAMDVSVALGLTTVEAERMGYAL